MNSHHGYKPALHEPHDHPDARNAHHWSQPAEFARHRLNAQHARYRWPHQHDPCDEFPDKIDQEIPQARHLPTGSPALHHRLTALDQYHRNARLTKQSGRLHAVLSIPDESTAGLGIALLDTLWKPTESNFDTLLHFDKAIR